MVKYYPETGEVIQRLRKLATLAKGPGLVPSTHVLAHNYL